MAQDKREPTQAAQVDPEIDALLAQHFVPSDRRLWWDAEHVLLGGLTAREALAAGERHAVVEAARITPGTGPHEPFLPEA
jgi:hypothetical protein